MKSSLSLLYNWRLIHGFLLEIRLSNHLESRHNLLLKFIPLNDRIIQLNLRQINQHTSNLWSFLLTNKLFNMLINSVSNNIFFLSSVSCLLVFLWSEHISDFQEIVLSIFLISILRNWWVWGWDDGTWSRRTSWQSWNVLIDQLLLLSIHYQWLVSLHLSYVSLVQILRWRSLLLIIKRAVSIHSLLVLKLLAHKLRISDWILVAWSAILVSWLLRELVLLVHLLVLTKIHLSSIHLLVLPEIVAHRI